MTFDTITVADLRERERGKFFCYKQFCVQEDNFINEGVGQLYYHLPHYSKVTFI